MGSTSKMFRQLSYTLREAGNCFLRGGLMSLIVVTTMMVALSVLGGFLLLVHDLDHISERVASKLQIIVFLANDTDLDAITPKIERLDGVVSTTKISKQEAKLTMLEEIPDISEVLENTNPFPDAIEVTIAAPGKMEAIVNQIKELPGVEEIQYNQELAEQIEQIKKIIQTVGLAMTSILALATLAIVFNTIHLAVNSRKNEIEIMQLVGASNWFIRMPFLLEGGIFGILSALLAGGGLFTWRLLSLTQIRKWFQFIPIQESYDTLLLVVLCMIPVGIAMGVLGSVLSVHRYLKIRY